MQAELQRDRRRVPGVPFKPGMNSRKLKQLKIAAKFNELVAEYFRNGGYGD